MRLCASTPETISWPHAENFLLLSTDDASPVKAIDFGLATFFDPGALPVTGLNVEGTPWCA